MKSQATISVFSSGHQKKIETPRSACTSPWHPELATTSLRAFKKKPRICFSFAAGWFDLRVRHGSSTHSALQIEMRLWDSCCDLKRNLKKKKTQKERLKGNIWNRVKEKKERSMARMAHNKAMSTTSTSCRTVGSSLQRWKIPHQTMSLSCQIPIWCGDQDWQMPLEWFSSG